MVISPSLEVPLLCEPSGVRLESWPRCCRSWASNPCDAAAFRPALVGGGIGPPVESGDNTVVDIAMMFKMTKETY